MSSNLEIRTVINLMVDGHMDANVAVKIIAESCGVPTDKLSNALRGMPTVVEVPVATTKLPTKTKRGGGKRNSFAPWTPQDEQRAVKMYNDGHHHSEIARVLKRTKGAVANKVYSLKISGAPVVQRPYTPKGFMLTHRGGRRIK